MVALQLLIMIGVTIMEIRTHVVGVDALIRKFDRTQEGIEDALNEGCEEAAEHLQECIEDKFGVYQDGWKPLKYTTRLRKKRMGNGHNSNKPLVNFGDMMFSFSIQIRNRTRKHTVAVVSDDERLVNHVYGAPAAGVPKRDPVRPTTKEERDTCLRIIADKVKEIFG